MTPSQLLDSAAAMVESASIREWIDRNRQPWLTYCEALLKKGTQDPQRLATYLVCVAMGF